MNTNNNPATKAMTKLAVFIFALMSLVALACDDQTPGDTMTKHNPVHDPITTLSCEINPEWSGCK